MAGKNQGPSKTGSTNASSGRRKAQTGESSARTYLRPIPGAENSAVSENRFRLGVWEGGQLL